MSLSRLLQQHGTRQGTTRQATRPILYETSARDFSFIDVGSRWSAEDPQFVRLRVVHYREPVPGQKAERPHVEEFYPEKVGFFNRHNVLRHDSYQLPISGRVAIEREIYDYRDGSTARSAVRDVPGAKRFSPPAVVGKALLYTLPAGIGFGANFLPQLSLFHHALPVAVIAASAIGVAYAFGAVRKAVAAHQKPLAIAASGLAAGLYAAGACTLGHMFSTPALAANGALSTAFAGAREYQNRVDPKWSPYNTFASHPRDVPAQSVDTPAAEQNRRGADVPPQALKSLTDFIGGDAAPASAAPADAAPAAAAAVVAGANTPAPNAAPQGEQPPVPIAQ
jgi:hypothetical protein